MRSRLRELERLKNVHSSSGSTIFDVLAASRHSLGASGNDLGPPLGGLGLSSVAVRGSEGGLGLTSVALGTSWGESSRH